MSRTYSLHLSEDKKAWQVIIKKLDGICSHLDLNTTAESLDIEAAIISEDCGIEKLGINKTNGSFIFYSEMDVTLFRFWYL